MGSCASTPISARNSFGVGSTAITPDVGRTNVDKMPMSVDLPAPFGPSNAVSRPARSSRLTPARARWRPNCLTSFDTTIRTTRACYTVHPVADQLRRWGDEEAVGEAPGEHRFGG